MGERKISQRELDIAMAMAMVCEDSDWNTVQYPHGATCPTCGKRVQSDELPCYCVKCGTFLHKGKVRYEDELSISYDTACILLDAFRAAMTVLYCRGETNYPPGRAHDFDVEQ